MKLIRKIIAVFGFLTFFWLLIPPIIKVDPATYACIGLTSSDRYTETQKEEIRQHMQLGSDYYYGYVSGGFSAKIIPAACFCLIASVCLLAGNTEKRGNSFRSEVRQ